MGLINSGTFHVFTFKDGIMAKIAHDLRLSLGRFEIQLEGDAVTGRFWPDSLKVDGSMVDGELKPDGLSAKDIKDIESNLNNKILHTDKHPEVGFVGKLAGDQLKGQLTMLGATAPVEIPLTGGDRVTGEVTLIPTQWGIKPFKALLGAIKLQDRVIVRFDLPRG